MFNGWETLFAVLTALFLMGHWFHKRTNTPFLPTIGMRLLVAITIFGWGAFYITENRAFGTPADLSRIHGALMIITGIALIATTPKRTLWASRVVASGGFALMVRLAYLAAFERPSGVYTFTVWALIMLNEVLVYDPCPNRPS